MTPVFVAHSKLEAPESVLKQKKAAAKGKAAKAAAAKKAALTAAQKHNLYMKKAAAYAKEYKRKEREIIVAKRKAKQAGKFYVPEETKVIFAIRILGTYGVSPKVRKILQLLRLRQINNGSFLRVNKPLLNMLVRVTPYVAWGKPNLKSVRELIYKRGYAKINGQRVPIRSNDIIAKALGHRGITCMEDLVHEIYTCGPNFKYANSFLWPFKLKNPNGGWSYKKTHFNEGGDAGDRKDEINELIRRMN